MKPIVRILSTFFVLAVVYTSCQNREWTNPFDPSCPKEIWTPTNFTAVQDGTTVLLTWNQPISQISGFKITKSVDGGTNNSLPDLAKGTNQLMDNTLIGGKNHSYSLTAYAGNNLSNTVTVQITPVLTALVATTALSAITSTSVSSGGNITSDGGATITARGVCWSTSQNPTITDGKTSDGTGVGSYNSSITGLNPGVTYYIRAYATNIQGTSYGNQVIATTSVNLPVLSTTTVSAITTTGATGGGTITSDGGAPITAKGVCWSTNQNPSISDNTSNNGTGIGIYTSTITGLMSATTYYLRAYATNNAGTAYGNQVTFTTTAGLSAITTTAVTGITPTSALSGGTIISNGGATISASGVCWSTSQNPTIANSFTTDGTGTGSYTSSITGLIGGTTYYVKAYATNSVGTAYGAQQSFTTSQTAATIPTLAGINSISLYINMSATINNVNVTSDGGATVTARGVCWSTGQNPTTSNSITNDGSGTGSFTSNITGLISGTTYYVRAYATNIAGTAYSNQLTFTTVSLPIVTTNSISNITQTAATSGGNVTFDGGSTVLSRGVCWSTNTGPTVSNSSTSDGTGTGVFTSNLSGLTLGSTYYLRAYASNALGTAYGNQISFTTLGTQLTPTFAAIGPLCQNSTAPALPLSSTNTSAITGTWNPAIINTANAGTSTYTFTPAAGQNSTVVTMNITITASSTPTFTAIGPLCQNSAAPVLPTTSTNGIVGTWVPSIISTTTIGTSNYTFTPAANQCGTTVAMGITITNSITPTFAGIGPLTQNSTAPVLPTTSTNSITGTWSPSTINTTTVGTLTYTFTPNAGQCATVFTMDIVTTPLTVTDFDGNVYNTVTIGTQVWVVENLKTTRYRNGDAIPNITDTTAWAAQTTGAYCWYNNDATANKDYGLLYNWYAVTDNRNIAPVGWHVPTDAEWTTLTDYLGGMTIAGGKMKETGTTHWYSPNAGATNSSGFTALPGGALGGTTFSEVGIYGIWWSSTASVASFAWFRDLYYSNANVIRNYTHNQYGFSVRCVRD